MTRGTMVDRALAGAATSNRHSSDTAAGRIKSAAVGHDIFGRLVENSHWQLFAARP